MSAKHIRSCTVLAAVVVLAMACARPACTQPGSSTGTSSGRLFEREARRERQLTPEQRLSRVLDKMPGEDPLFPVIMHSVERYLKSARDPSGMDLAVRRALVRHPELTRPVLEAWVENWHQVPESVKARFVPPELRQLSPAQKLDMQTFNSVITRLEKRPIMPGLLGLPGRTAPITVAPVVVPGAIITAMSPTDPDGMPYAYPGEVFTLTGSGFSADNPENLVWIFPIVNDVPQPGVEVIPITATPTQLEVICPAYLLEGSYGVQVKAGDAGPSEILRFLVLPAPVPPVIIDRIEPPAQYPGRKVVVSAKQGSRFAAQPQVYWRASDPLNTALSEDSYYATPATQLSDEQIEFLVPESFVVAGGDYTIAFAGRSQNLSLGHPFTVKIYRYQLDFLEIHCIDESNPEWWFDDEIVTQWAIIADDYTWTKNTGEYTGFSDGTTTPYSDADKTVFLPTGGPEAVRRQLSVGTALWEWDEGDVKDATEALGFVKDAVKEIPGGGAIAGYLLAAFSKLLSLFGGDPDALGMKELEWTAAELYLCTNNPQLHSDGVLLFENDPDTGSYSLSYRLLRAPD